MDFLACNERLEIVHEDFSVVFGDEEFARHVIERCVVQLLVYLGKHMIETFLFDIRPQVLEFFDSK